MKIYEKSDRGWVCEECDKDVDAEWRYVMEMKLSDSTDAHFATAFFCAEGLIGIPFDELRGKEAEDAKQAEAIVNCALYKTMIFTVKASIDDWRGDKCLKFLILRHGPVDHIAETEVRRERKLVIYNEGCVLQSLLQEIDEYGTEPLSVREPARGQSASARAQSYRGPRTPDGQNFGPSGFLM